MHNNRSQHFSPYSADQTSECWEGANPPYLLGKSMKDKLELLFLITIFVASVAAITPV